MIFENYFLVFFMYLTLEVINQERETVVMFIPRNYTEDKVDILICTGSCVKKKMLFHVVLGTAGHQREDRLYGFRTTFFFFFLEEHSELNFVRKGS